MRTPTFIVIGAAKCGTTSVCELLASHPDVFMSSPKEPHYFSRLTRYHERRSWYSSLFEGSEGFVAVGEGSTSYSHPHRIHFVVPRIRTELPECRLVYMVRHPVRRLESDWKMRLREGRDVSESVVDSVDLNASLVTFGLYWKHLQAYRAEFPDEQLLVVFLEDFAEDPERELSRIFEHIGVDPSFVPDNPKRRRNASSDYRRDTALASWLKNVPGYGTWRESVPDWAIELVKGVATEESTLTPEWTDAALQEVRGYFRDDARRLLRYCGKPEDFWSLE